MSAVHISLPTLAAFQRGMDEAPTMTRRELLGAMTEATLLLQREVQDRMPRGATGLTAASITSDAFATPMGVLGVVGSAQASARFVEEGTRPHWAPVAALVPWVRAVLGVDSRRAQSVAYLVARKIARQGTGAQHPFALAVGATQGQMAQVFERAAARVCEAVARGATGGGA